MQKSMIAVGGVVSARHFIPRSIERCANGQTIVRAFDTQRKAPRSFILDRITTV